MRNRKIVAVMMTFVMTVSIYSPVQAAGYCLNGNGSCPQSMAGDSYSDNNALNVILSNNSCNNGDCAQGAFYYDRCNNGNCVKESSNSNNCQNGNCVKRVFGGRDCYDNSNKAENNCNNSDNNCSAKNENEYGNSGNTCKIVIGGNGNSCNSATDIIKKYITGNGSNGTQANEQTKEADDTACRQSMVGSNAGQSVPKNNSVCKPTVQNNTTEQASAQSTSEKSDNRYTAGRSTVERLMNQTTKEQRATQVTTERIDTEKENTTEAATSYETDKEELAVSAMSEEQEINAGQVLDIVNRNRSSAGLHLLKLDADLCAAAQLRANEIVSSFSHTRPDGRKFSTVLTDNGIRFTAAGENIAWGQTSPEQVMNAWMNSDGHRANIMNVTYTKLGVGHVTVAGRQYWVQLFSY